MVSTAIPPFAFNNAANVDIPVTPKVPPTFVLPLVLATVNAFVSTAIPPFAFNNASNVVDPVTINVPPIFVLPLAATTINLSVLYAKVVALSVSNESPTVFEYVDFGIVLTVNEVSDPCGANVVPINLDPEADALNINQ